MQATTQFADVNAMLQMAADDHTAQLPDVVAVHPFQRVGLGRAPFRCTGVTDNGGDLQSLDSGERRGRCQYCTTPIRYEYHIAGADGSKFIVGSECVKQTGGAVAGFETFNRQMQARIAELRKAARQEREASKAAEAAEQWKAANPEAWAYIQRRAEGGSTFYAGFVTAVQQYGALSEGRMACVRRDLEQDARRAQAPASPARPAPAVVDLAAVEAAFAKASAAGIQYPKLRLGEFVFSPAGRNSANPGAIYVKTRKESGDVPGTYLGKVLGGKLFTARECTPEQKEAIVAISADPAAAAVAYGKRYGRCSVCNRELSDAESVERGIGPICAAKYGF